MRKVGSFMIVAMFLMISCTALDGQTPPDKKRPGIPNKEAQTKAMKLINDIFADDFTAAKDADAKSKLAAYLMQQGHESADDLANRYVLYKEARNLAAEAGNLDLTLRAVEYLDRNFEINLLEMKKKSLAVLAQANLGPESAKALVETIMPLIHEAVEADDYEAAVALGLVAETAARKSKAVLLLATVQKRNLEVLAVREGFNRLQVFVERLVNDPQDAPANYQVGKYHALLKGRWEKALPYLAKGSDDALKALAVADLARPKDARGQLALADGYWDLATKETEPAHFALQRRAMHWYEQAALHVTGLNRTKALKRIELVTAKLASTESDVPAGPIGELKKMEGHTEEIKSVAFSPDGRSAVSGGLDQTVRVWDLAAGKEEKLIRGHNKQVWSVAFYLGNRQVLSASWDATVRLWDVKSGNELRRFTHKVDVNGLALSRDGSLMLTGSDDQHVYLWNPQTGYELRQFSGHTGFVYCVAISPDGKYGASGSADKSVRVFDLTTGATLKVFEDHAGSVTQVMFAPDGRSVYSCGDNVIHQWDIAGGKEVRRFEGHKGNVLGIALSADGRRLFSCGDDKTIRMWDTPSGKELHRFDGHTDVVTCIALSPDGHRLLSGGYDRTVRLWGVPTK